MWVVLALAGVLVLFGVVVAQDWAIRRQRKTERQNMRRLMSYLERSKT